MKNRRKRLIVSLGVLLGVCAIAVAVVADPTCVLLGLLRSESFYQGRPTSYWSREIRRAKDIGASDALSTAQDWFSDLFRSNKWTRAEDIQLLKGGPEAAPVLKELLRDKNPGVRSTAAWALVSADDVEPREVVPALCDGLLDEGDVYLRAWAAAFLKQIPPDREAERAIPALILALNDQSRPDPWRNLFATRHGAP